MKKIINILCSIAVVVIIFILFFSIVSAALTSDMDKLEWKQKIHTVEQGESLWSISKKYCPSGIDCRDWIAEVEQINGICGYIYPGDTIFVLVERCGACDLNETNY